MYTDKTHGQCPAACPALHVFCHSTDEWYYRPQTWVGCIVGVCTGNCPCSAVEHWCPPRAGEVLSPAVFPCWHVFCHSSSQRAMWGWSIPVASSGSPPSQSAGLFVAVWLVFSGIPLHECSHNTHGQYHSHPHGRGWDTLGSHTFWHHWAGLVVVVVVVGTGQQ